MVWWIKVEALLTVQRVGPRSSSPADILRNPEQAITSQCPSSSSPKWGKNMFSCLSGKDTWLGASPSQTLEGSCRGGGGKAPGYQLPTGKHRSCSVPCKGSRAVSPQLRSWALSVSPTPRASASTMGACKQRRCDVTLVLVVVFSEIKDGSRQNTCSKNCTPEQHWRTKLSEQDRFLCTSSPSKYYHMCIKRLLLFTEC